MWIVVRFLSLQMVRDNHPLQTSHMLVVRCYAFGEIPRERVHRLLFLFSSCPYKLTVPNFVIFVRDISVKGDTKFLLHVLILKFIYLFIMIIRDEHVTLQVIT